MNLKRPFVVYMEDAPRRGGSGAHLRFFSNLRALSDAGAEVHLVRFVTPRTVPWSGDEEIRLASDVEVLITNDAPVRSVMARVAYRCGWPSRSATQMYFSGGALVEATMRKMAALYPTAVHFIEGESLAAAAIHTEAEWFWSEHERLTASVSQLQLALPAAVRQTQRAGMERERKFTAALDQTIVRRAKGSILISADTETWLSQQSGASPGLYLPTSLYDDQNAWPVRAVESDCETLSLLHLGSLSHLPSYTSLQYLLGELMPRLSASTLQRFRLTIVGKVDHQNDRTREILELASRFPNIVIGGFAVDLRGVYEVHHAQIVASTQGAGIRTRVVESFARGMPLIATSRSFDGLPGVVAGAHYASLPDDPTQAVAAFEKVVSNPDSLRHLREAGRALYMEQLARSVVAAKLRRFLEQIPE